MQGYAKAGLSPTAEDAASVVDTLTEAAVILDGGPEEPWESNEEAAEGIILAAQAVGDITGADPVTDTLLAALSGINDSTALVNDGLPGDDIQAAVSNLQSALMGLDARFPDAGTAPPPYTGMTASLGAYCDQTASELDSALLDGEPAPVIWTLQLLTSRTEKLTDIVSDLRTGINAIYPNPIDPVDPLTASLSSLVSAIVAALTPP